MAPAQRFQQGRNPKAPAAEMQDTNLGKQKELIRRTSFHRRRRHPCVQLEVFDEVDVVTLDVNSYAARRSLEPVRARSCSAFGKVNVMGGAPRLIEAKHVHSEEYGASHEVNHVIAQ
ncbi:hypothetical protein MRX96_043310 [Rhipicephalus microplus]